MQPAKTAALLLLVLAGLTFARPANAWWNDEWSFRKELTLDLSATGANVTENVSDAVVLVRLSLSNFTYFGDAKPDGADFRFVAADDKTPLAFHIEKFDPQAQIALVWVRVPALVAGTNGGKVYLYYGNPAAPAASDSAATYDAEQTLVYHFAASDGARDSTSFRSEPASFGAELNPASLIGSGARFAAGNTIVIDKLQLPATAEKGLTVSAWLRPDGAQQSTVFSLVDAGNSISVVLAGLKPGLRWRVGSSQGETAAAADLTDQWQHVALRVGSGKIELLVDGAVVAETAANITTFQPQLTVGGAAEAGYRGELDELQVAKVARSNGALAIGARSQGMIAPLLIYGGDAQKEEGGGESYFASTLRNVTVDGWVIIIVLAVMFVACVIIMIGKIVLLNAVARGNSAFLREFHRMRDDPAALEKREGGDTGEDVFDDAAVLKKGNANAAFGRSTLWQLYHHGMRETMKRLDGKPAGADRVKSLSPQSIEAIRATMDASQTRMVQRLQSQMVWLTIAIAGGPFLGLLGTVVGVMITFAAIAATGDVNINAIAPGTAAALVATVAGLAVAIPCLFGYNYLNTRVREIVNDMRVFVDEFTTRIAETYT
jgi:biopolymer transport protein ExbB